MITVYFRSSSYNQYDLCQQSYFIEYVLGHKSPSGHKAELGSCFHKIMEILALAKLAHQNNQYIIVDDEVGEINISNLYEQSFVDYIIDISYKYYSGKSKHIWTKADYKKIILWVNNAINYNECFFDPRNRHIIAAEQRFDIELKEDWAKYEFLHPTTNEKVCGNLRLKGTIDLITLDNNDIWEVSDYKGLPIGTKIPTIDGWKTMGELLVGDIVFDEDGKQTKIIGKSQEKIKECYEITFDDTSRVICDDEHIWKLYDGQIKPVIDLKIGDKISITKPLDVEDIDLPLDPYVLGIWLGDGRKRSAEITSGDNFIFEEINKRGFQLGINQEKRRLHNCETKVLLNTTHILRQLNLLNNKHIPSIYLRASFNQRLSLLRGLMDSDGNVNTSRKQAVFTNCNKRLSDDVKELLLSLGQRPYLGHVINKQFNKNIDVYVISFKPIDINPFLLPRKANRILSDWGYGFSNMRKIKLIKKLDILLTTQCIMVDSPSSTYLCTENFIPTHNTGRSLDWATGENKTFQKLCADPQLRIYHYALSTLFPDISQFIMSIFYVNDGGPYTMSYEKSNIESTKEMIKKRFNEVKQNIRPKLIKGTSQGWKCNSFCYFGKNKHPKNPNMTICDYIHKSIKEKGINQTVKDEINPNYKFLDYQQG